jgi:hypothetical protein
MSLPETTQKHIVNLCSIATLRNVKYDYFEPQDKRLTQILFP